MKHNWTLDELIDSWTLLPNELELIGGSKADHNRLAFALLLKYFQIEGKFPRHRREIPQTAVDYVARQLKLSPMFFSNTIGVTVPASTNEGRFVPFWVSAKARRPMSKWCQPGCKNVFCPIRSDWMH